MRQNVLIVSIVALLIPVAAFSATIVVPDDQPTIQAGIDAAVNGDTVLVQDGIYSGAGNWDLDFGGRAITVASMNGPQDCIIDCWTADWQDHRGFIFQSGEGTDSVVQGFTIREGFINGDSGGGIFCRNNSSPLITGNIITDCECWTGAGIACWSSSPAIIDNLIQNGFSDDIGGGIYCSGVSSPLIADNIIRQNLAQAGGGIGCSYDTTPLIINNLIESNIQIYATVETYGSGIHCMNGASPIVENCTLTDNQNMTSGCTVHCDYYSAVTVRNSIVWGNACDFSVDSWNPTPWEFIVEYSNLENGFTGPGNISADPLFTSGPGGDYYLSQTAAGQASDSPCLDTGNRAASAVCYTAGTEVTCLDDRSTRTDELPDAGTVDMGFHRPLRTLITAGFDCIPSTGTVPFTTIMTVSMTNNRPDFTRRLAGRIDVTLASGNSYTNWRAGYTNLAGGEMFSTAWGQNIPALETVIGDNRFDLLVEDVTPAPWNQPPYPPAGETDQAACTVTAAAP